MRADVRHANKHATERRAEPGGRLKLGLIINPIAGLGGPAGLKGTDGEAMPDRARALGAEPMADRRARRALAKLVPLADRLTVIAGAGGMGERAARDLGLTVEAVGTERARTGRDDTLAAAGAIAARGVDLLLFAGGDGTARDVFEAAPELPLLGVPTGVKMHSAVFAASPEAAGHVAALVLAGSGRAAFRQAEIMDIDEEALRAGHVAARLHGYAAAPVERQLMQNCKSRAAADDATALDALAARIVREMEVGRLYVLGCGETMRRVKRQLGHDGTLLGVDVALNGRLVATDLDEQRLLRLTETAPATVLVSVTGGQGFVFGRGNQQIGARLLRRVGRGNVVIMTGQKKLTDLDPPCLRVDTGDPEVDAMLAGYIRVLTAPGRSMIMRVAA